MNKTYIYNYLLFAFGCLFMISNSSCYQSKKDCQPGSADCICNEGLCDTGLYCDSDKLCHQCTTDHAGCPCSSKSTCSNGLLCHLKSNQCQPLAACENVCGTARRCIAEDAFLACLNECKPGFTFDSESATCVAVSATCSADANDSILAQCEQEHRQCNEDTENHQAQCGSCFSGYKEDINGKCHLDDSCEALNCAAAYRECGANGHGCGKCQKAYVDVLGECHLRTCAKEASPASILNTCNAQNRVCAEDQENGANCGTCKNGYVENNTGDCVPNCQTLACETTQFRECLSKPTPKCGSCLTGYEEDKKAGLCVGKTACESQADCLAGDYCVQPSPFASGRCEAKPRCGEFELFKPGATWDGFLQTCIPCPACTGDGTTGRIWPVTSRDGICVCETVDNYYFDAAMNERTAVPCDEDRDGWVRSNAMRYIEPSLFAKEKDIALLTNAHCHVRRIEQFVLRNEYGQELVIDVADINGVAEGTTSIGLYESVINDNNKLTMFMHSYYGFRSLLARELNPLTKLCVDSIADFNDNGISDIREWDGSALASEQQCMEPFKQFSYFAELHHGFYEYNENDINAKPRYVIAERSRCNASFPLIYDEDDDGTYWRNCMRRRAGDFKNDSLGYDFARFACKDTGTCSTDNTPLPDELANLMYPNPHGLCNLSLPLDATQPWRGMLHHSQFRCMQLIWDRQDNQSPPESYQVEISKISSQGVHTYRANQCGLIDEYDVALAASNENNASSLPNPDFPPILCEVHQELFTEGEVFWAADRFSSIYTDNKPENYQRGCINECIEFPELCPGYVDDPSANPCQGIPNNFGKIVCHQCSGDQIECDDNFNHNGIFDEGNDTELCETNRLDNPENCGSCVKFCPEGQICQCDPLHADNPTKCLDGQCCTTCKNNTEPYNISDDGCGNSFLCDCVNTGTCPQGEKCVNNNCASDAAHCTTLNITCGKKMVDGVELDCGQCPAQTCSAWGSCAYQNTCSTTGQRKRICDRYICDGNGFDCVLTPEEFTENCTRSVCTAGKTQSCECGTQTCSSSCTWGVCSGSGTGTCGGDQYGTCPGSCICCPCAGNCAPQCGHAGYTCKSVCSRAACGCP
ncbi:MAG: hypothetical protein JW841_17410 [Deltaproteobacteria bacterium]|nr:hypothetical protein [Deltaproteobacteria bacterium]